MSKVTSTFVFGGALLLAAGAFPSTAAALSYPGFTAVPLDGSSCVNPSYSSAHNNCSTAKVVQAPISGFVGYDSRNKTPLATVVVNASPNTSCFLYNLNNAGNSYIGSGWVSTGATGLATLNAGMWDYKAGDNVMFVACQLAPGAYLNTVNYTGTWGD